MKPKLTLRDLFWLVLVCALGLAWWLNHGEWSRKWSKREAAYQKENQQLLENLLIEQLVKGDPSEKMVAADNLRRLHCRRSVPFLLAEMREKYPVIEHARTKSGKVVAIAVYPDGKRVPYIDYHQPLFSAMADLAVPYIKNDEMWYKLIDRWIAESLPANERQAKMTWPELYKRNVP